MEGLAAGEVGVGAATEKFGEGTLSHQPVGDWNLPGWQPFPLRDEDPRMVPKRVFAGKNEAPLALSAHSTELYNRIISRRNEKMSGERKWARKSPPL